MVGDLPLGCRPLGRRQKWLPSCGSRRQALSREGKHPPHGPPLGSLEPCPLGIPLSLLPWVHTPQRVIHASGGRNRRLSPHIAHSAIPTKTPYTDCLQHLINLGSEPPFNHGCFPSPTLTTASLTKGCIGGCVQSCSWCTICPLPLLLLLSVSTWIALPSHRPCHF